MIDKTRTAKSTRSRGKIFSGDVVAWISQVGVLGASTILIVHGLLSGTWQPSATAYALGLIVVSLATIFVMLSLLLRLQAQAASRLHPGARIVTSIANVQFVAQLKSVSETFDIPAKHVYSGTYYAVAFDSDAIYIVLGSVRPRDIVRIPSALCERVSIERAAQGIFMQNCVELHLMSGGESLVIDLLLLRPLALAAVPLGRARLNATAFGLQGALHLD